jgi:hypothetical protein
MRSLLIALLCTAAAALAQEASGTISGTIHDTTGALVPNANITITNKATGISRALTPNAEGLYNAPALPPGDYDVRVEMTGFKTTVRPANVVAGSTTTVDMTLAVGRSVTTAIPWPA